MTSLLRQHLVVVVRHAAARAAATTAPSLVRHALAATRSHSTFGAASFTALRASANSVQLSRREHRRYSSKSWPSHKVVDMPALSPTMTQGNIGTWQKKVGDSIAPGDVLVEIETDKALMDFECQDEGYIAKILVESGTKDVSIGSPIVVFVDEQSDVAAFADFTVNDAGAGAAPAAPAAAKEEPKAEDPKAQPSEKKPEANQAASAPAPASSDRVKASPVAKKVANERGISLDQITATGPGGRILKSDVESFTPSAAKPQPVAAAAGSKPAAAPAVGAYTDIPLSNMRKTIASRLSESNQIIPHYYLTVEVEVDKILKLREVLNKSSNDKYKLSVNDFVIKASALALKQVPEANSAWQGEFIRQYNNADVCVAVATPTGLITPIVGAAEQKGLATISNQVKNLATRARDGKLLPHEYQGGTFTISNLGMFGTKSFTAIINPPQACILAVGGTTKKVVPDESKEGGFRVANVMDVTLTCDHRVIDGALGSTWLQHFKGYLENPLKLLL